MAEGERPAVRVYRVLQPPVPLPPPDVASVAARGPIDLEQSEVVRIWEEGEHEVPHVQPERLFVPTPARTPTPPLVAPPKETEAERLAREAANEAALLKHLQERQEYEHAQTKARLEHYEAERKRIHEEEEQRELVWARNTARVHADQTYQFVSLVSGAMGQATSAETYWHGIGQGAEAVDRAFENLLLEQERPTPLAPLPGVSSLLAEEFLRTPILVDDTRKSLHDVARVLLPGAGQDPLAEIHDLTEYADALHKFYEAAHIRPEDQGKLDVEKEFRKRFAKLAGAAVVPAPRFSGNDLTKFLNGTYPGKRLEADQVAELDRLLRLGDEAVASKYVEGLVPPTLPSGAPAASSTTTPPPPPSSDHGQSIRVDGKIYNHVENGKLTLLRLMFQKGGFNQMQFRAWDLTYNEGRITSLELDKKRQQASAAAWNPKDPVQLHKALTAQREILRMLRQSKESSAWRKAPENTGLVFLTDKFRFALNMAFSRVKLVAGCQHVPLIDLMVHTEVRTYFAYLVALEMSSAASVLAPTRYARMSQGNEAAQQRSSLLEIFRQCDYDAVTGVLVFSRLHDPGAAAQRNATQRRRALEYEVHGGIATEPAGTLSGNNRPFRRPRFDVDPRQKLLQLARAERMMGPVL